MPDALDLLRDWNQLDESAAVAIVLPCNGSPAWAKRVAQQRPFSTPEALFAAADAAWWSLNESDWQQAFDSHPRIGERHAKAATASSLRWSAGEQSTAQPDDETQAGLAEGNRVYEQRFGRIFIVCATGRSARELLAILQQRLANDPGTELRESAEQQRRITQLRLRKWLGLAAASCADV